MNPLEVAGTVSRARVARRIAAAAAYGGGGIGLLGGAAVGLLLTEARLAKRVVGGSGDVPPRADGRYGSAFARRGDERVLRLGFLGDSTAAGQGVRRARETPGALLASGLAAVAERPVRLVNVAQPGAQSDDLERQVSLLLDPASPPPDVAVVMIGANDVTHRMPLATSVRLLSDAVRRLRAAGTEVVVGTCPDLGSVEPVYQPLRWLARRASRQLAAAQTIAVVGLGGRTVSLGDLLGPEFEARPRELFGPDNFHPSAEGYATAAMAVLPTLCASLGLWPEADERPDVQRGEGFLPVAQAAAEAASEGGTEVTAAHAEAAEARGRWALLKRRRRRPVGEEHPHGEPAPQPAAGQAAEQAPEQEQDGERPPEQTPDRGGEPAPGPAADSAERGAGEGATHRGR
ncbi:SGNH/GDSL hydrolase family protein [Actinacidiphila guanduensis]|uniref:Lysophospholipase L1 n=1 Tax=Actinacidiphila guanduensis TaxID=310781 RepID=A0A1H0EW89_9ACTN|nr:SGNH/GDSL hydrolase family protein [Actinacidiphila guanduensis]SDN86539.1 Lysophospholipase L1 [Actinacidiphila guanduensis]